MEKKCKSMRMRFSDYKDNKLDGIESANLELHLQQCGLCRGEWGKFKKSVEAVRNLPHMEAPGELAESVLCELGLAETGASGVFRAYSRSIAVAASLLIVFTVTLLIYRGHRLSVPQRVWESEPASDKGEDSREIADESVDKMSERDRREAPSVAGTLAPLMRGGAAVSDVPGYGDDFAGRRPRSGEEPVGQVWLAEVSAPEAPVEIADVLRSFGAENITLSAGTGEKSETLGLNFDLDPEVWGKLLARLKREYGIRSAVLPEDVRKTEVREDEAVLRAIPDEAGEITATRSKIARKPQYERVLESEEEQEKRPPVVNITIRFGKK